MTKTKKTHQTEPSKTDGLFHQEPSPAETLELLINDKMGEMWEPYRQSAEALIADAEGMKIESNTDEVGYKIVSEHLRKLAAARVEVDKDRLNMVRPINNALKAFKEKADEIVFSLKAAEAPLKAQKDEYDNHARKVEEDRKNAAQAKFKARLSLLYDLGATSTGETIQLDTAVFTFAQIHAAEDEKWAGILSEFQSAAKAATERREAAAAAAEEQRKLLEAQQVELRAAQEKIRKMEAEAAASREALKEEKFNRTIEFLEKWKAEQMATGKYSHVGHESLEWDEAKQKWIAKPILIEKPTEPEPEPASTPPVAQAQPAQPAQPASPATPPAQPKEKQRSEYEKGYRDAVSDIHGRFKELAATYTGTERGQAYTEAQSVIVVLFKAKTFPSA